VIEVATFRADGSYTDGRRPDQVRFATPKEDAQRRDFTINGVFYEPVHDQVIDFVNGQRDIDDRVLRAIGDPAKRFAEDYLRMLRAVRFTSRFNLALDPATAEAVRANASKLPRIAPERICDELRATFAMRNPAAAAMLLDTLGLTPVLLRGLFRQPSANPVRPLLAAMPDQGSSFPLLLTLFLLETAFASGEVPAEIFAPARTHDVTRHLRELFRLSNEDTIEIKTILAAGAFLIGPAPSVSTMKRYLAQPASASGLRMLDALVTAGIEKERSAERLAALRSFPPDQIAPPPLVDGSDLQNLGYAPSPAYKRVLDAIYDAQLESRISTQAKAFDMAHELMAKASHPRR
jgi:poly(A) polymerase